MSVRLPALVFVRFSFLVSVRQPTLTSGDGNLQVVPVGEDRPKLDILTTWESLNVLDHTAMQSVDLYQLFMRQIRHIKYDVSRSHLRILNWASLTHTIITKS